MQRSEWDNGSRRHHYLPVFYIRGWTAPNGHLCVYDKEKDEFLRRRLSPRSVFYEHDGNTSSLHGMNNTIAEKAFAQSDAYAAELYSAIRTMANVPENNNHVYHSTALLLSTAIHFRVPANAILYDALYDHTAFTVTQGGRRLPEFEKALKTDETYKKTSRAAFPIMFMAEALERIKDKPYDQVARIREWPTPMIVLTDNPIVYRKPIRSAEDLFASFMLPITSRRLYAQHTGTGLGHQLALATHYNALAIEQALRLVVAPDQTILQAAVHFWKSLRSAGVLPNAREHLFDRAFRDSSTS